MGRKIVLSCDWVFAATYWQQSVTTVEKRQKLRLISFWQRIAQNRITAVCETLTRSALLSPSMSTRL